MIFLILINVRHTKSIFFFFNDTATTEIYTLSLHDALPICITALSDHLKRQWATLGSLLTGTRRRFSIRSEEHTSELQSQSNLVCRLLLEKKKKNHNIVSRHHTR